jgi:HlyD family secretion protein
LAAKHEKIDANLKLLDKQISDAVVTAPSGGSVIEKYSEKGEIVTYGKPLVKIADISKVWLKVYVSEEMLGKIKLGGKADVRIDSMPEKSFTGSITWISPKSEFTPKSVQTRNSRIDLVYAVKITLENPDGIFKIGMPAEVYIQGL